MKNTSINNSKPTQNTDPELLEAIRFSAEKLEIPDALRPDQVTEQLKQGKKQRAKKYFRTLATAACLTICFGAGGIAYAGHTIFSNELSVPAADNTETDSLETSNQSGGDGSSDAATLKNTASHAAASDNSTSDKAEAPLKKIGKMYTLAESYEAVYDHLEKAGRNYRRSWIDYNYTDTAAAAEGIGTKEDAASNSMATEESAADSMDDLAGNTSLDFSATNVQVNGVDESDIVKTDGKYIYVAQESAIQLLDARNGVPRTASTITPDLNPDTDQICEMYVDSGQLILIIQTEESSLKEENQLPDEDTTYVYPDDLYQPLVDDFYYIQNKLITKVLVYNIENQKKPYLSNTLSQDGWYQTSRKVDEKLYLFTNNTLYLSGYEKDTAVLDDSVSGWLPCVNDEAIHPDCIYLGNSGNQGLVMSAINLSDNLGITDTKMLINTYSQLYVSKDSVYLYYTDYTTEKERTRIARFALTDNGTIQAKAAVAISGRITDTFAIHEQDGCLYVLTSYSDWSGTGKQDNRVFVLSNELKVLGRLTGLAPGEEIYAARFIGNTGYFVTYRNTDPLFTVDLSDPENPSITGELKITGFSEYLHFWGEDKLLGIGYETDPDTGEQKGVKLSMFDISDPANVTEEARTIISDAVYCAGVSEYKSILVNADKNVIAFTTNSPNKLMYQVYSYKNSKFKCRLNKSVISDTEQDSMYSYAERSLYIGNTLYHVGKKKATAYDMKHSFQFLGSVTY